MIGVMGFKAMITEGAKHILGWKSPNFVYCNAINPRLKLLLKNSRLSDDLTFRFSNQDWSEFPLTAEKFVGWIKALDHNEDTCNLFLGYETFGGIQPKESGIFDFLKALPRTVFSSSNISFSTPSDVADNFQPVAPLNVVHPISWADEERDISGWLGNELQHEAFDKLFKLRDKVLSLNEPIINTDWKYLQTSDHFFYMSTKFFTLGSVQSSFNPYNSPYDAFINYMNILSDFEIKINQSIKEKETMATKKPTTKATSKPAAAKKTVAKKAAAKPAAKKVTAKPAAKKAVAAKKPAAKPAAKKAIVAKKPVVKKAAAKPAVKKAVAKPAAKKVVAKKPVAKAKK